MTQTAELFSFSRMSNLQFSEVKWRDYYLFSSLQDWIKSMHNVQPTRTTLCPQFTSSILKLISMEIMIRVSKFFWLFTSLRLKSFLHFLSLIINVLLYHFWICHRNHNFSHKYLFAFWEIQFCKFLRPPWTAICIQKGWNFVYREHP